MRRAVFVVTTILAGFFAAVPAAAATPGGGVIVTLAAAKTPVAPGGLIVAAGVVTNQSANPAPGPVSLTIHGLPANATLDDADVPGEGSTWDCHPDGADLVCVVKNGNGSTSSLGSNQLAKFRFTFKVPANANVANGLTLTLSALVATDTQPAPDLTKATTSIHFEPLADGMTAGIANVVDRPTSFTTGAHTTSTARVRNLGPAPLGGSGGSIVATGLVPPGASSASAAGDGWSCTANAATCTWTGNAVASGEDLPILTLTYNAPTAATAPNAYLTWTTVTNARNGATVVASTSEDNSTTVNPPPAPSATIVPEVVSDANVIAPATVRAKATVSGINLTRADVTMRARATLPTGFTYKSVSSSEPWKCGVVTGAVECTRNADFNGAEASAFTLALDVLANAPQATATIPFTVAFDGQAPAANATGEPQQSVSYQVTQPAPAALSLRPVVSGQRVQFVRGAPTAFSVTAKNVGGSPIAAGTPVSITVDLPSGTAATGTGWSCTSGGATRLTCTNTLAKTLPIDGSLPNLKITATVPTSVGLGETTIPVAVVAPVTDSITIPADITDPAPPPTTTTRPPRTTTTIARIDAVAVEGRALSRISAGGRAAVVLVKVRNTGNARSRFVSTIDLGASLVAGAPPLGCSAVLGGTVVTCTTNVLPPRASKSWAIRVTARSDAASTGFITVSTGLRDQAPLDVTTITVKILPASSKLQFLPPGVAALSTPTTTTTTTVAARTTTARVARTTTTRPKPTTTRPARVARTTTTRPKPTTTTAKPKVARTTTTRPKPRTTTTTTTTTTTAAPRRVASVVMAQSVQPTDAFVWNVEPTVSKNDVGVAGTPVEYSRARITNAGTYAWSGGDMVTNETVRYEWRLCETCDALETASKFLVPSIGDFPSDDATAQVIGSVIVDATVWDGGVPTFVSTRKELALGLPVVSNVVPTPLVNPTIAEESSSDAVVGTYGEWTIEKFRNIGHFLRCDDLTLESCNLIPQDVPPGAPLRYTRNSSDAGTYTRLEAFANGNFSDPDRGYFVTAPVGPFGDAPEPTTTTEPPTTTTEPPTTTTEPPTTTTTAPPPTAVTASTDKGPLTFVPNGADVVVNGSGTGTGALSYEWTQTGGGAVIAGPVNSSQLRFTVPDTGSDTLTFVFKVTDSLNQSATTTIMFSTGDGTIPATLCKFVNAANSQASPFTIQLGPNMSMSFNFALSTTPDCTAATKVTISHATMEMFGWFHLAIDSVSVDKDGITITGATLTTPDGSFGNTTFTGSASIPFSLASGAMTFQATFGSTSVPRVNLPVTWTTESQLTFAKANDGTQTIDFTGSAVRGGLSVAINGSGATNGTFNFGVTANRLITIQGTNLDFSGAFKRTVAGGPVTFNAAATLSAPITLTNGVTLDSASFAWDGSSFSGTGAATLRFGDNNLGLNVAVSGTDPGAWVLTFSANGSGNWSPISGMTIATPTVSGTIKRVGFNTVVDVTVGSSLVTVGSSATVDAFAMKIAATCNTTCAPAVTFSGNAHTNVGGTQLDGPVGGSADFVANSLALTASVANFTVGGVDISNASFAATRTSGQPLALAVNGTATVLATTAAVSVKLSAQGYFASFSVDNWTPVANGPTIDNAALIYSSYATTVPVDDKTVSIPANTLRLAAAVDLPEWLTEPLGANAANVLLEGTVGISPSTFDLTAVLDFGHTVKLVDAAGVLVSVERVGLNLVKTTATTTAKVIDPGLTVTLPGLDTIVGPPSSSASSNGQFRSLAAVVPDFDGSIDFPSKSFSLTVHVADLSVGGVDITDATFQASKQQGSGLDLAVNGTAEVLGSTVAAHLAISDKGYLAAFEVQNWTPVAGGPTIAQASVIYATYATSVPVTGGVAGVEANTLTIAASVDLPTWLTDGIVPAGSTTTAIVSGEITLKPSVTFDLTANLEFGTLVYPLNSNGVQVGLRRLGVRLVKTSTTSKVELLDPDLFVSLPGIGVVVGGSSAQSFRASATTFDGSVDFATKAFTLKVATTGFTVAGVAITDGQFSASKANGVPLAFGVSGTATVMGSTVAASVDLSSQGYLTTFVIQNWTPVASGPTIANASFVYANYDTQVAVGDKTVDIPKNNLMIAAALDLPSWLSSALLPPGTNTSLLVSGGVSLNPLVFNLDAVLELSQPAKVLDANGVQVTLQRLALKFFRSSDGTSGVQLLDSGIKVVLPLIGTVVDSTTAPVSTQSFRASAVPNFDGTIDFAKKSFSLSVDATNFDVGGVTITDGRFTASKTDGVPLALSIAGSANVLDTDVSVNLAMSQQGYLARFAVGTWTPVNGGPTVQNASVVYANYETDLPVGTSTIHVAANTLRLAAALTLPDWMTGALLPSGTTATALFDGVIGTGQPRTYDVTAVAQFSSPVTLINSNGVQVSLQRIGLHFVKEANAATKASVVDPGFSVTLPLLGQVVTPTSPTTGQSFRAAAAFSPSFDGSIDFATKSFTLTVTAPAFAVGGVEISDATFTATKAPNKSLALAIGGTATVLDTTASATLAISGDGYLARFAVANWTPVANGPTVTNASVLYSSYATSIVVDGKTVAIPARTLTVAAGVVLPSFITSAIVPSGVSTAATLSGSITPGTPTLYDINAAIKFSAPVTVLNAAGVTVTIRQLGIRIFKPTANAGATAEFLDPGITFNGFGITASSPAASTATTSGFSTNAVTFTNSIDLANKAFSLSLGLDGLSIGGVTINSAHLVIDRPADQAKKLTYALDGNATIFGSTVVDVAVSLSDQGYFAKFAFQGDFVPFTGAPTLKSGSVIYSSYATTTVVNGKTIAVPARVFSIAAVAGAPQWFNDIVGASSAEGAVSGSININNNDANLSVTLSLSGLKLFDLGGASISLNEVSIGFAKVGASVSGSISAPSSLTLPALSGGTPTVLPITVGLAYTPSTQSISGALTVSGNWTNAFGVTDLTIKDLSLQVSLSRVKPSVGIRGEVTLPPSWGSRIGVVANTPIALAAQLSGPTSCFGIEIGKTGNTNTIIDVANAGVVTAKHASVYIAPFGCTIGTTTIPAGIRMAFDGSILGVALTASLNVTPAPFALDGTITIGDQTISGVTLKGLSATVAVSQTTQSFSFKAKVTVLGVSADVTGLAVKSGTSLNVKFTGAFDLNIGGYQQSMLVDFDYTRSRTGATSIQASSTTKLNILGSTADITWAFGFAGGVVTQATGNAVIHITVGDVVLNGTADVKYVAGTFPTIKLAGDLSVYGNNLTSFTGTVTPGGVALSAHIAIGSVLSADLAGAIAFKNDGSSSIQLKNSQGTLVTANSGDFRFDATNVGVTIAGFTVNTDLSIGNVRGGSFVKINGVAVLGVAGTNATVALNGSFSTQGVVDLAGTASVTLGGVPISNANFLLSYRGASNIRFEVSGVAAIPSVGSVNVRGNFSRDNTGTHFLINAAAQFSPGGVNLGVAQFEITESGVTGKGRANIPSLGVIDVTFSVMSNGIVDINTSLTMGGNVGAILGSPTANVHIHGDPDPTKNSISFRASVNNVLGIPIGFTINGTVSTSGNFSVSVDVPLGPYGDRSDWGVCTAYWSAEGNFHVSVSGSANAPTINVNASMKLSAGCGSVGVTLGGGVNFSYTPPTTTHLKVYLVLGFGDLGSWEPTLIDV